MIWISFILNLIFVEASVQNNVKKRAGREGNAVSIIFVGDISFDGCMKYYVKHGFCSYNASLRNVAGIIKGADIAVGNLESPFVTKTMLRDRFKGRKRVFLDAEPCSASALKLAGFDVMTLANNHLNDYGEKPVNFTTDVLNNIGIKTFGLNFGPYDTPQQPLIVKRRGIKIGFLGYCDVLRTNNVQSCMGIRKVYQAGPATYSDRIAEQDVRQLKGEGVDVVIVYMHWGREYDLRPTGRQMHIAKYLHSLGVSAVIGAHPHTLQPHSKNNNHVTAYSIGNFLFPQHGTRLWIFRTNHLAELTKKKIADFEKLASTEKGPTSLSRIFRLQVTRNGVVSATYLPVDIKFDPAEKILQPTLSNGNNWIDVCSTNDKACLQLQQTSGS